MEKCDILVIGGGPAGLFAAANIRRSSKTIIIEKNSKPGKKLLMAGAGRCNITHSGQIKDFFSKYGENIRFLKTALQNFTNQDLISFFNKRGVSTYEDKNGKVFPKSEKAADILDVLIRECRERGAGFHTEEAALSICKTENGFSVRTNKNEYRAAHVIISTGGKSYPGTGSTGDGYNMAKELGHTIIAPKPSLTPIFIKNYRFADISGVSLGNRTLQLYRNEKKIKEHRGDIGFTHKGLSGPGVLDFSRHFEKGDLVKVNLIESSQDSFREDLIRANEKRGKTTVKNYLKKYDIPESLVREVLDEINLESTTTLACLPKKTRNRLVEMFCNYPFEIGKIGNFNVAMATAGGVALKEISPKTMESRIAENLFFAGELMDIDGNTGGYNIQAAFSTGFLAANTINNKSS